MKQKHLFSLLDGSFTTIRVVFKDSTINMDLGESAGEHGIDGQRPGKLVRRNSELLSRGRGYCYKAPKDMGLAVDDIVVVDTPQRGLVTAIVTQVDESPEIDLDADFDYKWVVQRVDRTAYDQRVEREREFSRMMLEVERTRQREALVEDMRKHLPEGSQARQLFDRATMLVEGKPFDIGYDNPDGPQAA